MVSRSFYVLCDAAASAFIGLLMGHRDVSQVISALECAIKAIYLVVVVFVCWQLKDPGGLLSFILHY